MRPTVERVGCDTSSRSQQGFPHRTQAAPNDDDLRVEDRNQVAQPSAEVRSDLCNETAGRLISCIGGPRYVFAADWACANPMTQGPIGILGDRIAGQSDESRAARDGFPTASLATIALQTVRFIRHVTDLAGERRSSVDTTVNDDGTANTGTQRDEQDIAIPLGRTEPQFPPRGGIRIVVHHNGDVESRLEFCAQRYVGAGNVGAPHKHSRRPGHHPGDTDTHRFNTVGPHRSHCFKGRLGQVAMNSFDGKTSVGNNLAVDHTNCEHLRATEIDSDSGRHCGSK